MTPRNLKKYAVLALFGLTLMNSVGLAWSAGSAGQRAPGYDRVGKNIVGGMRGHQVGLEGAAGRGRTAEDAATEARTLANRKSDLTKRMFWIMLSMR